MCDREKVIKGLECCLPMMSPHGFGHCSECPYKRRITLDDGIVGCCGELIYDALELLKGQEPVEPKHIHQVFAEHDWELDEEGKIDTFAMDVDFHNGPVCKRCHYSFCEHCEPDGYTKVPCVIDKDVCPTCGHFVYRGQKYCSECGQAVKWE